VGPPHRYLKSKHNQTDWRCEPTKLNISQCSRGDNVGRNCEAAAFSATAYPAGLIITTNKSLAAILPRAYAANKEKKELKRTHVWNFCTEGQVETAADGVK
jgi:hypothetical protein